MASSDRLSLESLSPLHWVAIALALVTAAVHRILGIGFLPTGRAVPSSPRPLASLSESICDSPSAGPENGATASPGSG